MPTTYATDNSVLASPVVQKVIAEIKTNYAWSVEQTSLEKRCLLATQEDRSEQSSIEACIAAIVESLDGHSSYYGAGKTQELMAQNSKQPEPITTESLFSGEIGYIAIPQFLNNTRENISLKAANFLGQPRFLTGLIIDLRNCPGGTLQSVIDVAGLFLPDNTLIGTLETQRPPPQKRQCLTSARGKKHENVSVTGMLKAVPLVVLVNQNTARGAEFLAAALRESGRATVIGSATARKGDVQTIIPLSSKSFLKLTTHILLTSSGHSIGDDGVRIDIESSDNALTNTSQRLEDDPVIKQAYAKFKSDK